MTTQWPSAVACTSISIMSAFQSASASRKAASVFSGFRPEPPRCATSIGVRASTGCGAARRMELEVGIGGEQNAVDGDTVQPVQHEIDEPRGHLTLEHGLWIRFRQQLEVAACEKKQNVFHYFRTRTRGHLRIGIRFLQQQPVDERQKSGKRKPD